jgi:hypothetical protein
MATHVYFDDEQDSTERLLRTSQERSNNEVYDEESLAEQASETKNTKKVVYPFIQ